MNMKKEDDLNRILNSLQGIKRAKAPNGAFNGIQQKLADQRKEQPKPERSWLGVAAVILIIVCSNAVVIAKYYGEESTTTSQMESSELITDLNLYQP